MLHQQTALCLEYDQLAVLASAALPERKQMAETGTLASEKLSDISNGASIKSPIHNKPEGKRVGIRIISKGNIGNPPVGAVHHLAPLPPPCPPTNQQCEDQ